MFRRSHVSPIESFFASAIYPINYELAKSILMFPFSPTLLSYFSACCGSQHRILSPHQVLVRLRVEHAGFPAVNQQRFGAQFVGSSLSLHPLFLSLLNTASASLFFPTSTKILMQAYQALDLPSTIRICDRQSGKPI